MTDAQKAKAFSAVYSYNNALAQADYGYELGGTNLKISESGMDPIDYIVWNVGKKNFDSDGSGQINQAEFAESVSGLKESDKAALWEQQSSTNVYNKLTDGGMDKGTAVKIQESVIGLDKKQEKLKATAGLNIPEADKVAYAEKSPKA